MSDGVSDIGGGRLIKVGVDMVAGFERVKNIGSIQRAFAIEGGNGELGGRRASVCDSRIDSRLLQGSSRQGARQVCDSAPHSSSIL